MPFPKLCITLPGANFILEQFDIAVLELSTGGYRAVRFNEIVTEGRVLKDVAKKAVAIASQNSDWLKKEYRNDG